MKLSHKDLVKLGRYESGQGYSLGKIEDDFLKKGIKRADTIKALDEVDYYNKLAEHKEAKNQKDKNISSNKSNTKVQSANEKKSSFWPWFILLVLIGAILYLYFSGMINFDWLRSINFKYSKGNK